MVASKASELCNNFSAELFILSFREMTRLSELELQAKTEGKGKWNKEKNPNVCGVCYHAVMVVYHLILKSILTLVLTCVV